MSCKYKHLVPIFAVMLLVVFSLACNLPISFLRLQYGELSAREEDEIIHDVVGNTSATLVSPEGEVIDLPLLDGTVWECKDIDGELSFVENNADAIETQVLKTAELEISLRYFDKGSSISVHHKYLFEREDAVMDGVTNTIKAWDQLRWSGNTLANADIGEGGYFSGFYESVETREATYPEATSAEVNVPHNFFGLIVWDDYKRVYYCDLHRIGLPGNPEVLTPENFQDHCQLYYYECSAP